MSTEYEIEQMKKQYKDYLKKENKYKDEFKRFKPVRNILLNSRNRDEDPYKTCLNDTTCRYECYDDRKCKQNVDNYKTLYDQYPPHYNNNITFDDYIHDTLSDLEEETSDIVENVNRQLDRMDSIGTINDNIEMTASEINSVLDELGITMSDSDTDDILAEIDRDIVNDQYNHRGLKTKINRHKHVTLDDIAEECSRRLSQ